MVLLRNPANIDDPVIFVPLALPRYRVAPQLVDQSARALGYRPRRVFVASFPTVLDVGERKRIADRELKRLLQLEKRGRADNPTRAAADRCRP
jgi:hypothetical protein